MQTLLISVSDKTGLIPFLSVLKQYDTLQIYATGTTATFLAENQFECQTVESLTGFPEILDGRVKTLHPKVFGGILAKNTSSHQVQRASHEIPAFDWVIVNLYPFEKTVASQSEHETIIENIDIGGVALLRAAAKNYNRVSVLANPESYMLAIQALNETEGKIQASQRLQWAKLAFENTARYDALISQYFAQATQQAGATPERLVFNLQKQDDLRYGENPHEKAVWYLQAGQQSPFSQLQGKALSANNISDSYAAFRVVREFPQQPACAIIKHNNPCGVAIGQTLEEAYHKAYQADPTSAFGGVFAFNQPVTDAIAEQLAAQFIEIVLAPSYCEDALTVLAQKKNVRVLVVPSLAEAPSAKPFWQLKDLDSFGWILQENALHHQLPELKRVTQMELPESALADVDFAWSVAKHLTSNAIVIAKEGQTLGLGMGQTSRIGSMTHALAQAGEKAQGAVLASDGFFPATDNIDAAAEAGIIAIIQPGGSIKDVEIIEKADQRQLAMAFTGERCFRH
jgi:phosphoribosylaminoimidazolecarboxamide formyltransferase / IMP cyclohydrolase